MAKKHVMNGQRSIKVEVHSSETDVKVEFDDKPYSLGGHNKTLEREEKGCYSIVVYSFTYIMLEVWKQVTTYGMKYFNNNEYPLPQTQIVAITEVLKLIVFIVIVGYNGHISKVQISFWYAIPSVIYAINNNVYYFALHYTTPPIWNVVIQLRIIFTALSYRIFFKKQLTTLQWIALVVLMTAIALTNLTGGQALDTKKNLIMTLVLAVCGSVLSVVGTVTMEYLFKNDNRTFSEMQLQLYLFSSVMTWVFYGIELYTATPSQLADKGEGHWHFLIILIMTCILLTSLSGVAVAAIVKKLDNIVKLYTQALANMLTSIACTMFFPDHFHLNALFMACLFLMFLAIMMYENKNFNVKGAISTFKKMPPYQRLLTGAVTVSLLIAIYYLLTVYGGSSPAVEQPPYLTATPLPTKQSNISVQ